VLHGECQPNDSKVVPKLPHPQLALAPTGRLQVLVYEEGRVNTNYWKSFVQARLAVAMGDNGCLSLFGTEPEHHRLLAEHLTAEYRVQTQGRGRTVDEWKLRPERSDHHWLDCLLGAAVSAAIQGAALPEVGRHAVPRKERIRLSDIKRRTG